jgi:hypothetical protein
MQCYAPELWPGRNAARAADHALNSPTALTAPFRTRPLAPRILVPRR